MWSRAKPPTAEETASEIPVFGVQVFGVLASSRDSEFCRDVWSCDDAALFPYARKSALETISKGRIRQVSNLEKERKTLF
jgi:hypothetical protein